jgi:DNA polymerase-1
MLDLERKAHELAGALQPGLAQAACDILFERLKLQVVKKTPSGAPRWTRRCWRSSPRTIRICKTLLEHRGLSKLKSTYTDKLPRMVQPKTGACTPTTRRRSRSPGRLSSNDPNLQNIPVRTPRAAHPRRLHRAARLEDRLGRLFADRAAHHGAPLRRQEPVDAFPRGEDVHRHTAREVFDTARRR